MISPEIFYDLLRSRYDTQTNPNILHVPKFFGAKSCVEFGDHLRGDFGSEYKNKSKFQKGLYEKIVLHDQEPMSDFFVCTYRDRYKGDVKEEYHELIEQLSTGDLTAIWLRTTGIPLWCHSELSSKDISSLVDDHLFLEVYYWYHGMISRDWFRLWKYYPELEPRNRSDSAFRFLLYARGVDGTRLYRSTLIEKLRPWQSQILHHWDRPCPVSSTASAEICVNDAQLSSIHIVAETLFETDKIHLTEKIFKPMVMSQPFLLFAGPGSLKYLRSYGFQTFGEFWNEDYDLEVDPDQRMQMILTLVQELASMSHEEFDKLYQRMLPVIDHNRRWFFSDAFQDILVEEMYRNFRRAFDDRKRLAEIYPGGQWFYVMDKILKSHSLLTSGSVDSLRYYVKNNVPVESVKKRYPLLYQYISQ